MGNKVIIHYKVAKIDVFNNTMILCVQYGYTAKKKSDTEDRVSVNDGRYGKITRCIEMHYMYITTRLQARNVYVGLRCLNTIRKIHDYIAPKVSGRYVECWAAEENPKVRRAKG